MKRNQVLLLGLLLVLLIAGCKKDPIEMIEDYDDASISSRTVEGIQRDVELINSFYQNVLEIQGRTGFYNEFHEEYGYFNWSNSMEFNAGEGKILFVPVIENEAASSKGGFLYYKGSNQERIKFFDKSAIESKFDASSPNAQPNINERFAYKSLVLNDLQRNIENNSNRLDDLFETSPIENGDGETPTNNQGFLNDCNWGYFQLICAQVDETTVAGGIDASTLAKLKKIYEDFSEGKWNQFHSMNLQELEDYVNSQAYLNDPFHQDFGFEQKLLDYLEARRNLGYDDPTSGILYGVVVESYTVCNDVWVWCWEDPADYEFPHNGSSGSSSNNDFNPLWQDAYDRLRFCEGVDDVFDTGPDNPSAQHPDFDFCSTWMNYLEDCILPTQGPLQDPLTNTGGEMTYIGVIETWAEFFYYYPGLFTNTIADPQDCTSTADIENQISDNIGDEECLNALAVYEATFNVNVRRLREKILNAVDDLGPPCNNQEAFNLWANAIIIDFLSQNLGLTTEETDWLSDNANLFVPAEVYEGLFSMQNLGRCGEEDKGLEGGYHEFIKQRMAGNTFTAQTTTSLLEFFSVMKCDAPELFDCFREAQQNPDSGIANFLDQVKQNLLTNNRALLNGCSNLSSYEDKWFKLASFDPLQVQAVENRLNDLDDIHWIQTLENAQPTSAIVVAPPYFEWWIPPPTVNMDYFGVTITTLPNKPYPPYNQFTSGELFQYLQQEFISANFMGEGTECYTYYPPPLFTEGGKFLPFEGEDAFNWMDGNPLGAIFTIKMADDGSVICSDFVDGSHWTFSTLNAPGWFEGGSWDGYHPVSGNREFGLENNGNGTFTFYTSGVDRLSGWWHAILNGSPLIGDGFEKADDLWKCFLDQTKEFVEENGGVVSQDYDCTTVRPKWDELKSLLQQGCEGNFPSLPDDFPCKQASQCN